MESGEPSDLMFGIRRARASDAPAIGRVHVETWRNTYAGILPDHALAAMSERRQATSYERMIRDGHLVLVAQPASADLPVGFITAGRARSGPSDAGEVETLYVQDDWRECGIGRRLLVEAARRLAAPPYGCRSLLIWVLSDNPSRWFYEHLGGKPVARSTTSFGGRSLPQTAMLWNSITTLAGALPS